MAQSSSIIIYASILLAAFARYCSAVPLEHADSFTPGKPLCKLPEGGKVNVHLVPHTHDDVGWLKTVDEYYYGANNSIQHAGVQYILDSVIEALQHSEPDLPRHFIYVEIAFFIRWFREQDQSTRERVHQLVANGQLEFINGGWCMNDEAATHYNAIIDQMTLGLQFIENEFGPGARPRVAWHIDPFGHSSEQASLFAQMGFDSFFFGRIDYDDKKKRLAEQRMEMIWRGSSSLGSAVDLFTGVTYHGYNPPPGFCFDQLCHDPPIQDDPRLFDNNVEERVKKFVDAVRDQACHYRSGHIMMTMGSDFEYENAKLWYKNLDKLIRYVREYVEKNGHNITLFYSTPTKYMEAVHDADLTWEVKTDDFFPYADCPHCFWTGYFTSRPAIKRYVRMNNNLLQVCFQMESFFGYDSEVNCQSLREAMAVAQHHDAVSGTEKQHVANDYAKRLAIGAVEAEQVIVRALGQQMPAISNIELCPLLNISVCQPTESSDSFSVVVYNPLVQHRTAFIRVPLAKASQVVVLDADLQQVPSQLVEVSPFTKSVRNKRGNAPVELVFEASLAPLGYTSFSVSPAHGVKKYASAFSDYSEPSDDFSIENALVKVTFSGTTGRIVQLEQTQSSGEKLTVPLDQQFLWYNASVGSKTSRQASGAYIFRPNSSLPFPVNGHGNAASVTVVRGPVVQEVWQIFSNFSAQIVRLYSGTQHVELEYTVGPIPFHDHLGKEVISRFSTDLASDGVFYTDANGREMQRRVRNHRDTWKLNETEPVAQNYYPVNSRIYLRDEHKDIQLTILNDRSQGGSSMKDGSLELMVHRRLLHDDGRGVGEPLNETGVDGNGLIISGKHYLALTTVATGASLHRRLGLDLMLEPVVAFGDVTHVLSSGSFLKSSNVSNAVHVLTLQRYYNSSNELLLRLEHIYESNEGVGATSVSLKDLFKPFDIAEAVELTLSANQYKQDEHRLKWKTTANDGTYNTVKPLHDTMNVVLQPMEIRTFRVKITSF